MTSRRSRFLGLLRVQWASFCASRGRLVALAASVLITVSLGLLVAGGARSTCVTGKGEGPCPAPLVGPDGTAVRDKYFFVHQPLTGDGGVTARVSHLAGRLRLPDAVPGVRNVEEGVVPWAKAGLLIRQSLRQGTPYAAVMLTGEHGVRMQHNYVHDLPGGPHNGPQWLRLTRSGDIVTGYESDDGERWTEIGTVRLAGLPPTVEIGMFATSPGALWESASAFSQVTATFDEIEVEGANGAWRHDDVGVALESDGRTPHHPGGAVESGGRLVVTGGGDIGPATVEGGLRADLMLIGGALGLIPVLVAAATFGTAGNPRTVGCQGPARLLAARATVAGVVAFVTGLVSAGVVVPAGLALLRVHQNPIQPIGLGTGLRVIAGHAALTAVAAVLALGLAALLRRAVAGAGLAVGLVVLPQLVASAGVAPWLLVVTPAAGFAVTQSVPTFAHVDVHPSLLGGYHPLAPAAGLTVACGFAAVALGTAMVAHRGRLARGRIA
uniref:PKD domain containing protein n=1 Tax=Nonomuraea gerenzanensis TaxID=93944 RepID=A0A1M4ED48_9ACTN|nr:PKD domain containing protein [Nonomuraea gerenzanensis]